MSVARCRYISFYITLKSLNINNVLWLDVTFIIYGSLNKTLKQINTTKRKSN